jgi:hypothetical protein
MSSEKPGISGIASVRPVPSWARDFTGDRTGVHGKGARDAGGDKKGVPLALKLWMVIKPILTAYLARAIYNRVIRSRLEPSPM